MAAISGSGVRRAMLGRIPFLCQGRVKPCSRRWRSMAETVPLQEIFQIVVMVAVLTTEGRCARACVAVSRAQSGTRRCHTSGRLATDRIGFVNSYNCRV